MEKQRTERGGSLLLVVGRYGGFHFSRLPSTRGWHVCLGWIAFTIFPFDVEIAIDNILKKEKEMETLSKMNHIMN